MRRALIQFTAAAAVATTLVATALAAAPANDDFADARGVRVGTVTLGSTSGATRERFEPALGYGEDGGTVWYELRATATGEISISTCGTASDHHLGVFTGSALKVLAEEATGDHSNCPVRRGSEYGGTGLNFSAVAGRTYRIAVGAFERSDEGGFQLVTAAVANYPNDAFAAARSIRVGRRVVENNELATAERGEPRHARLRAQHSLWFRFRAPATGRFRLSTEGSSFDTRIAVYRGGALGSLRRVASNDDASARTVSSRLTFRATRGTTYRIALDGTRSGVSSGQGDAVLTLSR